ncbi:MAG TPA: pyruvate carboxylase subunit B [Thermotogaceae bacterium]|nr:pyruvate carboxylase subunit B [Thermotogaceae bacterium]
MKISFTDTTLRDAHQSLLATRMKTEDMIDALEYIDEVGYHAIEMWGGATFDVCVRFLNEDPWNRIREIKKRVKNVKLQMLLRGQNLVGYRHYADDTVELFVKKAVENGIEIIRVFDALNDIRNLRKSIEVAKREGAHVQGAISYTESPVHTIDYYVNFAEKLIELDVDSLCVKDMAGLLHPRKSYKLIKELKKRFAVPIELHSHCTTGLAESTYFAAMEAGVDILDVAISPLSGGTSQPAVESMAYISDSRLNKEALNWLSKYFSEVRKKYSEHDVKMMHIDARVLFSQVPGGMYSNLVRQLKEQKMLDKLQQVLEEIPKVRKDLGYPPLVTPTSQIVGVQAVLNVMMGERYARISNEVKNYVKGLYGKPPAPIDSELTEKILGDEKPIDCRPADIIEPEIEKAKKEIGVLASTDEELLIYVILGEVGRRYLEEKYKEKIGVDFDLLKQLQLSDQEYPVYPI